MIDLARKFYVHHDAKHPLLMRVIRFGAGGALGAVVDLASLYALTDLLHVWYVISTPVAFVLAFAVSFLVQKYWTFRDHSNDRIHSQVVLYFVVGAVNLFLNSLLVSTLVHFCGFHYILAQICASLFIAGESYFIYQRLFRARLVSSEALHP